MTWTQWCAMQTTDCHEEEEERERISGLRWYVQQLKLKGEVKGH